MHFTSVVACLIKHRHRIVNYRELPSTTGSIEKVSYLAASVQGYTQTRDGGGVGCLLGYACQGEKMNYP